MIAGIAKMLLIQMEFLLIKGDKMLKVIERAMQIVALRALDNKDNTTVFAMTEYEANLLRNELISIISLELSETVNQQEKIKDTLYKL